MTIQADNNSAYLLEGEDKAIWQEQTPDDHEVLPDDEFDANDPLAKPVEEPLISSNNGGNTDSNSDNRSSGRACALCVGGTTSATILCLVCLCCIVPFIIFLVVYFTIIKAANDNIINFDDYSGNFNDILGNLTGEFSPAPAATPSPSASPKLPPIYDNLETFASNTEPNSLETVDIPEGTYVMFKMRDDQCLTYNASESVYMWHLKNCTYGEEQRFTYSAASQQLELGRSLLDDGSNYECLSDGYDGRAILVACNLTDPLQKFHLDVENHLFVNYEEPAIFESFSGDRYQGPTGKFCVESTPSDGDSFEMSTKECNDSKEQQFVMEVVPDEYIPKQVMLQVGDSSFTAERKLQDDQSFCLTVDTADLNRERLYVTTCSLDLLGDQTFTYLPVLQRMGVGNHIPGYEGKCLTRISDTRGPEDTLYYAGLEDCDGSDVSINSQTWIFDDEVSSFVNGLQGSDYCLSYDETSGDVYTNPCNITDGILKGFNLIDSDLNSVLESNSSDTAAPGMALELPFGTGPIRAKDEDLCLRWNDRFAIVVMTKCDNSTMDQMFTYDPDLAAIHITGDSSLCLATESNYGDGEAPLVMSVCTDGWIPTGDEGLMRLAGITQLCVTREANPFNEDDWRFNLDGPQYNIVMSICRDGPGDFTTGTTYFEEDDNAIMRRQGFAFPEGFWADLEIPDEDDPSYQWKLQDAKLGAFFTLDDPGECMAYDPDLDDAQPVFMEDCLDYPFNRSHLFIYDAGTEQIRTIDGACLQRNSSEAYGLTETRIIIDQCPEIPSNETIWKQDSDARLWYGGSCLTLVNDSYSNSLYFEECHGGYSQKWVFNFSSNAFTYTSPPSPPEACNTGNSEKKEGQFQLFIENLFADINIDILTDLMLTVYNEVSSGCNGLYQRVAEFMEVDGINQGAFNDALYLEINVRATVECDGCLDEEPLFTSDFEVEEVFSQFVQVLETELNELIFNFEESAYADAGSLFIFSDSSSAKMAEIFHGNVFAVGGSVALSVGMPPANASSPSIVDDDDLAGTSLLPKSLQYIEDACTEDRLANPSDRVECEEVCEPAHECCDPFASGDSTCFEEQVSGCITYAKCHSLNGWIDPAHVDLDRICSVAALEVNQDECELACESVVCCFSDVDSCFSTNFQACLDYAVCHNLKQNDPIEVAKPDLTERCENKSPTCERDCKEASCCSDSSSKCYRENFVSCLSYSTCTGSSPDTQVLVAPIYSQVAKAPDNLEKACFSSYVADNGPGECQEACAEAACCFLNGAEGCFGDDPLGCLEYKRCSVIMAPTRFLESSIQYGFFEGTGMREPTDEEIAGLIDQTEQFYSWVVEIAYPSELETFEIQLNNWTFTPEDDDLFPFKLDFTAIVTFSPNAMTPIAEDMFAVLEGADSHQYIQSHVWQSLPVGSIFFKVQRTLYVAHREETTGLTTAPKLSPTATPTISASPTSVADVETMIPPDWGYEDRYGIRNVTFEFDNDSLTLKYVVSDYILDDSIRYILYNDGRCRRGDGTLDITKTDPHMFLEVQPPTDEGPQLQNKGTGDRLFKIYLKLNPTFPDASYYTQAGLYTGQLNFCVGFSIIYNQVEAWKQEQEVNFVEIGVWMNIDNGAVTNVDIAAVVRPLYYRRH